MNLIILLILLEIMKIENNDPFSGDVLFTNVESPDLSNFSTATRTTSATKRWQNLIAR